MLLHVTHEDNQNSFQLLRPGRITSIARKGELDVSLATKQEQNVVKC